MSESTQRTDGPGELVRDLVAEVLRGPDAGRRVTVEDDLTLGSADGNTLVLTDRSVSRYHVELRRAEGRIAVRDLGSTNGTQIGPVHLSDGRVTVEPGAVLRLGRTEVRIDEGATREKPSDPAVASGLVAASEAMRKVLATVRAVASRSVPVLLLGESGTGKELLARALHEASTHRSGPLVTLDCGAVAPALVASELFGHERGAFTGAHQRHVGAFERAHGGTLFLDEIGELPAELQPMLLGALERRRIRRVGGQAEIDVDVRVVSATHRDLRQEVNRGAFRLDLYYRIAVVLLHVPPLRARPDDIVPLLSHFLVEEGDTRSPEAVFSAAELASMRSHPWPGNVRELRNVVAAALATGAPPLPEGAPPPSPEPAMDLDAPYREARRVATDDFERRYLRRLLERADGNVREAARLGRMDRSDLIDLLKRHDVR